MAHGGVRGELRWRTTFGPGDIGALVRLHGTLYSREYGYDRTFEAYVAAGIAEFVLELDKRRDRLWLVERDGGLVASIAIVHRKGNSAQLRWYLVHPDLRGRGLGRKLMGAALRFCRTRGYKSVFLWTTSELEAAAHIYLSFGFRRAGRKAHDIWGRRAETEERYELKL